MCVCVCVSKHLESGLSETGAEAQTVATGPSNPHLSKSFTLGKSAGTRLHASYYTSMIHMPILQCYMLRYTQCKERSRVFEFINECVFKLVHSVIIALYKIV